MKYKRFKIFLTELFKSVRRSGFPAFQNITHWNRWNEFLDPNRNSMDDEQPWLTFSAIDFIKKNIRKEDKVFEYGGGGSTLFFLKAAALTITVEHDEKWFAMLSERISLNGYKNWKGLYVAPTKMNPYIQLDAANPGDYYSSDENFKESNFRNYVISIDNYPNEYFDWVLVDGRARPSCIMHAIDKIKVNGYLILDNSDRDYYLLRTKSKIDAAFKQVIKMKAPAPYLPWFSETTIWTKK